jgi:hypothetical protein
MKTLSIIFSSMLSLVALNANAQYDDVYYDPDRHTTNTNTTTNTQEQQPAMNYDGAQPTYSTTETDANGNTYITNNYYDENDDYNDYFYSSRLRRFYNPSPMGLNFWDPWFTNYYFYDMNPLGWNSNIFFSTNMFNWNSWGGNGWNNGWGNNWNNGWGNSWGSYSPCFSPFYDPYIWHYQNYHAGMWNNGWNNGWNNMNCGWGNNWNNGWGNNGWGNNGYWNGYNNGYWNGYYDGQNNAWNNGWGGGYGMWGPRREMGDIGNNTSHENTEEAIITRPGLSVPTNGTTKPNVNDIPKEGLVIDRTTGNVVNTNPNSTSITTKPNINVIDRTTTVNTAPNTTIATTKPNTNVTVIERAPTNTNVNTNSNTNTIDGNKQTQVTTSPKQNAWQRWGEENTTTPNVNTNDRSGQYSNPNTNTRTNTTTTAPTNTNTRPNANTTAPSNTYTRPNVNTTNPNNVSRPNENTYTSPKQNTTPTYNNNNNRTNTAPSYSPPAPRSTPSTSGGNSNGVGGSKMGTTTTSPRKF